MTSFERFAPAITLLYMALAGIPLWFGAVVFSGGTPVTPELYGPLVYAIPAKVWIGAQLLFATTAALGAGLQRPRMAAVGGFGTSSVLGLLAVLAVTAGAEGTLAVSGSVVLAALSTVAAQICWGGRNGRRSPPSR